MPTPPYLYTFPAPAVDQGDDPRLILYSATVGVVTLRADVTPAAAFKLTGAGFSPETAANYTTILRSAFEAEGFTAPRVAVSLRPGRAEWAETLPLIPGEDGILLPVAVIALVADGQLPDDRRRGAAFWGSVSLAGRVYAPRATTLMARHAARIAGMFVTGDDTEQDGPVRVIRSLGDLRRPLGSLPRATSPLGIRPLAYNLSDYVAADRETARRIEMAAELWLTAGDRALVITGPAGCSGTMLARRLVCPLAPGWSGAVVSSDSDAIYDLAGLDRPQGVPFRAPHHTASRVALEGHRGTPGELDLATGGVLLIDDAPDFSTDALAAIEQWQRGRLILRVTTDHPDSDPGVARLYAKAPDLMARAIRLHLPVSNVITGTALVPTEVLTRRVFATR